MSANRYAPEICALLDHAPAEQRVAVDDALAGASDERLELLARFVRYAAIDTRACESGRRPSSAGQTVLQRLLVDELRGLGLGDARLAANQLVEATLPARGPKREVAPVLVLVAHVDTAPECSGGPVRVRLHPRYPGGDIVIDASRGVWIEAATRPHLAAYLGHDILTADGTTLLGADNKAGVAEIMQALARLVADEALAHPTIRVLFTSDEELGIGAEAIDFGSLRADVAYTVDGDGFGCIDVECLCIDGFTIDVRGSTECAPLWRRKAQSALDAAAAIIDGWSPRERPESTAGREGFIEFSSAIGDASRLVIDGSINDFAVEGLSQRAMALRDHCRAVQQRFAGIEIAIQRQLRCRNMHYVLKKHPIVVARAVAAAERVGIGLTTRSGRYGIDAASFCFRGVPAANLFCGFHDYHSVTEHISLDVMQQSVDLLVALAGVWASPVPQRPRRAARNR
ncbi:MAG: tripeptide aminopeptidase PepT [Myxococcales bacterium]|nr:tripeptide aminopeptidase PepT [Myxococcales bacterium]